ncbi:DUF3237 domain-containing protein [Neomicrococcus lactis]|uniref:UPF0311 protein BKA12_001585 n=1 Tax=Neomicrococcus lactis TaxID=732241 RepID=A0A7W9DBB9_9MICC|nr:DUF3237 domain-containing protein [Neomicrococcus lactis]MBB5598505.1 hypothetical protein [Neomicrococcus lactis]
MSSYPATAPTPPGLAFVAQILVDVGSPIDFGQTSEGHRRVVPIIGGTVSGPRLQGTVLPMGADFQLLRSTETTELDARYGLELDDGSLIYVHNLALRYGLAADIAKLNKGEPVDPSLIYFRCMPRLMTSASKWEWMNHTLFAGTGERLPSQVRINIFKVE